ncbi:protein-disulfide reductase DsbD family protein [Haloferula sp.]|uniref:protein-disulfide reductase DsbD family protein n=1 Tax=Haloferula sp. TaxID=2497595 RepID=UPI003C77278D
MQHFFLFVSIFSLSLISVSYAQFSTDGPPVVEAELISEQATIAPGQEFEVALVLKHAPHWHTYYVNPGLAGFPPEIEWTLPEGFTAGEIEYPTPVLGEFAGAPFYGYEGETWFLTRLVAPTDLAEGTSVEIKAEASWLACEEQCVPGDAELVITLKTGPEAVADPNAAAGFVEARVDLPKVPTSWSISASPAGSNIVLDLAPNDGAVAELNDVHFFSSNSIEDSSQPQVLSKTDTGYRLSFPRNPETDPAPTEVVGILKSASGWADGDPSKGLALKLPIVAKAAPVDATTETGGGLSLISILGLMFIGGLILNLMPCVFPVIGLKIMGFVQQAGHSRKKVVAHGLVFSLGVLVSFWILAGILLAGGIANWGGQLENPWVVYILLLVMLIFGLSMFGLFEIGASATGVGGKLSNSDGLGGTFFSGVLATVVATPCSAPFLGTALGAAVTLPGPLFMLAFTMMALGLATPYLVLSFFPSLVEKLPRPGPWMESFKQGMSFLLFGTAGFLLWVYSVQVFDQLNGQKGIYVMLGLTAIATAFWIYGRWDLPHRSMKARWVARLMALSILTAGFLAAMPSPRPDVSEESGPSITWETWSKERQDQLIAEGTPVFVDFTARWCLTCQTNKAAAYTEETAKLFEEYGIVALKADKTTTSPAIDAEIRRLGKSAIPVNVLYPGGSDTPIFTNTVLTAGYLQDFLRDHLTATR